MGFSCEFRIKHENKRKDKSPDTVGKGQVKKGIVGETEIPLY